MDTKHISTFLKDFRENHQRFIELHKGFTDPINYEIELSYYSDDGKCHIKVSCANSPRLTIDRRDLLVTMDTIADWTNNVFECGCTFTMGW